MRSQAASVVRASATPWPLIAASIAMLARFSTGPCVTFASSTPAACSHLRPVGPAVQVDQRKLEDIGRLAQPAAPGQQFWTAHREQLFRAELDRVEARPVAVAMADREIDFLAREVDMMQGCRHAQVDVCVRFGKMPEPVHQPLGGEIRRRADGQDAGILPFEQPLGAERDPVQRIADDGQIVAARFGDDEALAFTVEQLDGELGFERLDLMADRSLRHAKLVGRPRETLMPRGGLEGLQGIERLAGAGACKSTRLHEKN